MKASAFPRIYKAFDLEKNIMLSPKELASRGFTIAPDGLPSNATEPLFNIVVLWWSGQIDHDGKQVFEGDICKVHIKNEFGSIVIDYGIMRWVKELYQFILMVPSAQGGHSLDVQKVELLGNEFENPELVPLVQHSPEANGGE